MYSARHSVHLEVTSGRIIPRTNRPVITPPALLARLACYCHQRFLHLSPGKRPSSGRYCSRVAIRAKSYHESATRTTPWSLSPVRVPLIFPFPAAAIVIPVLALGFSLGLPRMYQHRVSTLVGSSWNPLVGPSSSPRLLLKRSPRLAVAAASNSHISTTTASSLYSSSSASTATATVSVHTPVAFLRSFSSCSAFASASASAASARSRAMPMASPHSSESSAAPTPASSASSARSSQTSLDPTSPVDVDMQENMKQTALDQHGHSQATGSQILREPLWNKGESQPLHSALLALPYVSISNKTLHGAIIYILST